MAELISYRFRAECRVDICRLQDRLPNLRYNLSIVPHAGVGDCEATLEIALPLEELRAVMRKVQAVSMFGHVMVQTLAMTEKYTGERNWSIS